jgi:DNA-binding winged helix-turn-helix (wHTH) protein
MNLRYAFAAGSAIVLILLWAFVGRRTDTSFDETAKIVLFRRIGDQVLLSAGDSTSRVLPVRKISGKEYRLEFANPFTFEPDSLVSITDRMLKTSSLPSHYIVNVVEGMSQEVVYSFEAGVPAPCIGRLLPENRYSISILFPSAPEGPAAENPQWSTVIMAGMLGMCVMIIPIGFFSRNRSKQQGEEEMKEENAPGGSGSVAIGKYLFFPPEQELVFGNQRIELTAKESRLLAIFAAKLNQTIDRNTLLKEGWEDEGVITGRSLDMYVSRLRKKLQKDPSVGFINVHGKGYRLTTFSIPAA